MLDAKRSYTIFFYGDSETKEITSGFFAGNLNRFSEILEQTKYNDLYADWHNIFFIF